MTAFKVMVIKTKFIVAKYEKRPLFSRPDIYTRVVQKVRYEIFLEKKFTHNMKEMHKISKALVHAIFLHSQYIYLSIFQSCMPVDRNRH